jgi:glycosyltransferase involved in cell wall biosynthesis
MKVLHIISAMDPATGGVCNAVRTIISGLNELNVHNEVASLDAPGIAYQVADPFEIHALGPGQGPWCFNKKLIPWLLNNLGRFDIVILHGLWLYNGYAVEKALRLFKRKLTNDQHAPKFYVMPHGMLDPYFQKAKSRKLKALRNIAYWQLIERHIVNRSEGLLFTCEEEKELSKQPFRPYSPKREIVVGLGVEKPPAYTENMRDAFRQSCPGLNGNAYLLFLSRIHEKKGVDLLIQAYREVYHNASIKKSELNDGYVVSPDIDLPKLIIAGPNHDSSYGQKIREMVKNDPLIRNNIFFTGMLSGNAKWGAFYGCEAFVLASHQENFGMAVVESLACKRPVLISNQVNIYREIENNGAGIVAPDTIHGSIALLKQWSQLTMQQRTTMGENSYVTYLKYFTITAIANRFLTAISSRDFHLI